jgi:hypothetical protein
VELDTALAVLTADHAGAVAGPDWSADLAHAFGLAPLDVELLLVAAAPELDATFGAAYAALQGDPTRLRPSCGLALELCGAGSLDPGARGRLGPAGALRRGGLLDVVGDAPLLARSLVVPDRVVAHLAGEPDLHPDVVAMLVSTSPVPGSATEPLARALQVGTPLAWVAAPAGTSGSSLAVSAFAHLDAAVLTVDLLRRPHGLDVVPAVRLCALEAGLLGAGLVVLGLDEDVREELLPSLALLARVRVPVVVVGRKEFDTSWLDAVVYATRAAQVTPVQRVALWQEQLGPAVPPASPGWTELMGLRLTPEEIAKTARHAALAAAAEQEPLGITHVRESARQVASAGISGATRTRPVARFDDLVAPPGLRHALHEIVDWATHRDAVLGDGAVAGKGSKGRGITALFGGAPGTGKTLAAEVIASTLGMDLQTVDLSTVVDKYIGETEKNLERIFASAENLNIVLLFDEADALFGSRSEVKDARDRYANQEVAYLLQRMERFDGIAILTTNLGANLDKAFTRRLQFVLHFPDPDAPTRRLLWANHLQPLEPHDAQDPVDLDVLAERVPLAGGDIRNIVLATAYLAAAEGVPVGMRHVVSSVEREYRKLGRRLPAEGFARPIPGRVTE